MNTIEQTEDFSEWLKSLRDLHARARIIMRIKRAEAGNFGDCKHFDGITEMRVDVGPGYRLYLGKKGETVYLLLAGGDKSSQVEDIKKAKDIWGKCNT